MANLARNSVDDATQTEALRIIDYDQWYTGSGQLKGLDAIQLWHEEEERALAENYNDLRILGNTRFVKPNDWPTFGFEWTLDAPLSAGSY